MSRSAVLLTILLAGVGITGAQRAHGQAGIANVISNNNAVFNLQDYVGDSTGTGTGPVATFSVDGSLGPSALSQAWWWGRVQGSDPREFVVTVTNPVSSFAVAAGSGGDQFSISYFYNRTVTGGAIVPVMQIDLTFRVAGYGLNENDRPYGQLFQTATVRNLTGTGANNPATTFAYNLFNFNATGVFGLGAKTATQLNPTTVRLIDGLDPLNRLDYQATGPAAVVQVGPSSGASRLRNLLTNATTTNLVSGISGAPGNLEIASQFTFTLTPGSSQTATVVLTVPTPGAGAVALMGMGGLLMARGRRRR